MTTSYASRWVAVSNRAFSSFTRNVNAFLPSVALPLSALLSASVPLSRVFVNVMASSRPASFTTSMMPKAFCGVWVV